MSRKAFALAVAVALHVGFAWVLFAPKPIAPLEQTAAPEPAPRADARRAEAASRTTSSRRTSPRPQSPGARYEAGEATAGFASAAERAGYERGTAYELARREAVLRYYERTFGADIGALMRQPLREAWPALERRALAGDDAAAHALNQLATCEADLAGRANTYRRLRERAVEGLAPVEAAFVHGALDAELLELERVSLECRANGFGDDRLARLAERRLEALGRARPIAPSDDRHAWLEQYEEAFGAPDSPPIPPPTAEAQRWLDRLEAGLDFAQWTQLEREFPDDPSVTNRVAYCAMARCDELPPQAWDEADRFVQRAAEYGYPQAVGGVVERATRGGALAQAHAWSEFGMWVIEAGCFPVAQSLEFAQLARQRAAIAARLTAAQYAEARRLFAALIQAHGNEALAAQGCTP